MSVKSIIFVTTAAMLLSAPVWAHHSGAMFDNKKTNTLAGTIKDFQFENPHAWIYLTVAGADGVQKDYSIEMTSPNLLQRNGWRPGTLHPGDKVTLKMHPLNDGADGGSFVEITLADGKVLTQRAG